MGETTAIEWCHHTCNPWMGCTKISAGCAHCYASESTPVRVLRAGGEETWGPHAARHETAEWEAHLRRWNRAALAAGERRRVFVSSLADVFEDHPALPPLRERLWSALEKATALDVLLLTKRPENILRMVPPAWAARGGWPVHIWIGCTVEERERLSRLDHLRLVPAPVRFVSFEPLLEDLGDVDLAGIAWGIIGGESGDGARSCNLAWVRRLVAQLDAAGAATFVKQLGARPLGAGAPVQLGRRGKGGDMSVWPADLAGRRALPRVAA